jgi:hypothetical protein
LHAAQTQRRGERLRRAIEPRGILGAHDDRETIEGRRVQPEFFDYDIESAELAAASPQSDEQPAKTKGRGTVP